MPALDGHATGHWASGSSFTVAGLTTSNTNDVIAAFVLIDSGVTVSSLSTTGISWQSSARKTLSFDNGTLDLELWYGTASGTLNNVTTTVTMSGSPGNAAIASVFGISGVKTSNFNDPNASLPTTSTGNAGLVAPSVTGVSTSNANDFIIVGLGTNTVKTQTASTNYTLIDSFDDPAATRQLSDEYQAVTSTQSSVTITWGQTGGGQYGIITDAIESSSTAWQGTSVFRGTGNLSALPSGRYVTNPAFFFGKGLMLPTVGLGLIAAAEFDASGSLSALAYLALAASATLSGSPSLSVYGALALQILVEFDGAGSVTANSVRIPSGGVYVEFDGGGSLSAVGSLALSSGTVPLVGTGSLLPTVFLIMQVSATFKGSGLLTLPIMGFTLLSGAGSLSANTTQTSPAAFFLGGGGLIVTAGRYIINTNQFGAAGRMCVQATVRKGRGGSVVNMTKTGPGVSSNIVVVGG